MLRVTVELVPFGNERLVKKIGEMVIANRLLTDEQGGHSYDAWTAPDSHSGEDFMFGRIYGFDRRNSVWELISLLLQSMRGEMPEPDYEDDSLSQRLKRKLGHRETESTQPLNE